MKTTKLIRSITVAGALAAALSLSACDMKVSFGPTEQNGSDSHQPDEVAANPEEAQTNDPITEDSPDTSSSQGTSSGYGTSSDEGSTSSDGSSSSGASTSAGSSSSSSEGSSSSSGENTGASDPGFDIDEHGNGTIPASMLEDDIRDAYSKQGTTIDEVECLNDLMIISERGSASCNVTAHGEKRYGTVKVTSVTGANVHYKLDFPSFN